MDFESKIEEIRQKPEHIRLRYVWALVTISMIFVLLIWFFSLKADRDNSRKKTEENNILMEISNQKQVDDITQSISKNMGNNLSEELNQKNK
ncbi:MAG: hypothetical protein COU40_03260 [Candidatus Moranbacteria bacterium CG10_big_fil_rev_8_21_14_0_10_35_21]|nr:MAG: hypothetical protein COU40_03260 [Candidatus Moranbacteria bacterium CG10_big_fil_rev_8_21_14_0_10_35_21]PJA88637.1 MAG: hypothetical protein CO139_01975 [Candidatus Moranbacteria bacterium CG_4_9_14_3_um_filter_36_9]